MKKIKLPFKLLIYDIETRLKPCLIFSLGEQVIRHNQLEARAIGQDNIICIAAKWYNKKEIMLFHGLNMIKDFDEQVRMADVVMGKNSDKFDAKYINTERMMQGLKPYPEWADISDDLEKKMRRYFYFPSQSLDYISKVFGTGGKVKMEFNDWVDIHNYELLQQLKAPHLNSEVLFKKSAIEIEQKGLKALKKMYFYNKKDVTDTEACLSKVLPYIKLRHNSSVNRNGSGCITCGSTRLIPTKIISTGKTKYQEFECLEHDGYGGKATIRYDKQRHKLYGKMG
jgi:hypothetical protein